MIELMPKVPTSWFFKYDRADAEKSRPPGFPNVIGALQIAMWLREFCGFQWCFVLLSGDKCNSIPMAVV
jgi:hypothetical protein